jgi:hypothetical protein
MSAKAARDLSLEPCEVKVLAAYSKVWDGGFSAFAALLRLAALSRLCC